MTERDERIEQEAIDWLVRLGEADAGEWEAFTLWLEADPAHAARYEALAAADRDWGALARPARQVPPLPVRRGPSRPSTRARPYRPATPPPHANPTNRHPPEAGSPIPPPIRLRPTSPKSPNRRLRLQAS